MPRTTLPVIVCFGDSLTVGFQSSTRENPQGTATPYGHWLQAMLGGGVQVRVSGVCGEVTGEMVLRFRHDVLDHRPRYAVILGGTNDLGWNAAPAEIMRNLVKMYEQTFAAGGIPVPVTVPSLRVQDSESSPDGQAWVTEHLARRRQLNEMIQAYAGVKHIGCVDLFAATAERPSGQLAAEYSNDGLHLTTAGYRVLAEQAAQVIKTDMAARDIHA